MAKDFDTLEDSNRSGNPSIHEISPPTRRTVLRGAAATALLAGDPANARVEAQGNVKGDAFACPDGLWVDGRGVLWIQTDMSTSAMGKGDLARLGNNALLAADPVTGEVRRFLVGPSGCEVTGATGTPDGRNLFINIQHPGESPSERSDPAEPQRISNWPDRRPDGRPRSATVVIRRKDGGLVGT